MNGATRFRRVAGYTTLGAAAFSLAASVLFLAASGFDWRTLNEPSRLLGIGSATIVTLRWSLVADMLVYLLSIPLFLCLGSELASEHGPTVHVFTTSGVFYSIIGALAATIFLYAGPPLLHAYTGAAPSERPGITLAFATLTDVIYRGLWETLELIPMGVWAIGTGLLLRTHRRRLGTVGVVGGAGVLLIALCRITQAPTVVITPFLPLLTLVAVYQVWLGVILLRDPAGPVAVPRETAGSAGQPR